MNITKVTYYDIGGHNNSNFLSKCSVVFDDCVMLHDIKILNGEKGRYIVMPERIGGKSSDNSNMNKHREDIFHPVRQTYFTYMKSIILKGFSNYENKGCKEYIPK